MKFLILYSKKINDNYVFFAKEENNYYIIFDDNYELQNDYNNNFFLHYYVKRIRGMLMLPENINIITTEKSINRFFFEKNNISICIKCISDDGQVFKMEIPKFTELKNIL